MAAKLPCSMTDTNGAIEFDFNHNYELCNYWFRRGFKCSKCKRWISVKALERIRMQDLSIKKYLLDYGYRSE